jgi:hypothetical protein
VHAVKCVPTGTIVPVTAKVCASKTSEKPSAPSTGVSTIDSVNTPSWLVASDTRRPRSCQTLGVAELSASRCSQGATQSVGRPHRVVHRIEIGVQRGRRLDRAARFKAHASQPIPCEIRSAAGELWVGEVVDRDVGCHGLVTPRPDRPSVDRSRYEEYGTWPVVPIGVDAPDTMGDSAGLCSLTTTGSTSEPVSTSTNNYYDQRWLLASKGRNTNRTDHLDRARVIHTCLMHP